MLERALLYTAEVTVAAVGRVWRRAAGIRGIMAQTRAVAARAYDEFVTASDEASEDGLEP